MTIPENDNADATVDATIRACLDLKAPSSFFLFAGAGSGKTRSLVEAIKYVRKQSGDELRRYGKRIGVITFTNAASDEIKRRLDFDPLVEVSTIHSFAWTLISGFNADIREWLKKSLTQEIAELEASEAKGKKGTKASAQRQAKIASKSLRLGRLDQTKVFTYSPAGDNSGKDALNHAEVMKISSAFLNQKKSLRSILVNRYPVLLIDESQDTNRNLIDALFAVQAENPASFSLGMFGDTMQRIYTDGKENLGQDLPIDWETPAKQLNFRCSKRIIKLINKIRGVVDGQVQMPSSRNVEGYVRLFILPADTLDKPAAEQAAAEKMAEFTGDADWNLLAGRKTLILEHRMAARRMGFEEMFVPLHSIPDFRTSVLDGTFSPLRLFANDLLPLVRAEQKGDKFKVARILSKISPLLAPQALKEAPDQPAHMEKVRQALASLMQLWADGGGPTFRDVLLNVIETGLVELPPVLLVAATAEQTPVYAEPSDDDADQQTEKAKAIDEFLSTPFKQIEPYALYVSGQAPFDTHQGVKGLEFPRVMVIMDDGEARGFSFSYDKLFGGKDANDPTVQSTRRLFYVTCSRAEKSLALVAYTAQPNTVRSFITMNEWFDEDEIQMGV